MTATAEVEEIVEMESLDEFVSALTNWHESRVALLEHMLQMPEGTPFSFNDGKDEYLTGDLHRGFLVGLTVALGELGTLPFLSECEEDEPVH